MNIGSVTLLVRDYDEAIRYFTNYLNFVVREDVRLSEHKRWVTVSPDSNSEMKIVLAQPKNDEEKSRIGNQTGGRVFLFLETENFESDYKRLKNNGVEFIENIRSETYGKVVVFKDLYGNKWDLVEKMR